MATDDFFRARLEQMINLRHPLAELAGRTPWSQIEATLAPVFSRRDRHGRLVEGSDLFGMTQGLSSAGMSAAGRPRLPIRLMAALLYLKHAFNLSDQELVVRQSENVVWQYFSGLQYYTPKLLYDATQIGRVRRAIGEAGEEELLKATIDAAVGIKVIGRGEFERVIVDTTVQEKAVAHLVDSRLLAVMRMSNNGDGCGECLSGNGQSWASWNVRSHASWRDSKRDIQLRRPVCIPCLSGPGASAPNSPKTSTSSMRCTRRKSNALARRENRTNSASRPVLLSPLRTAWWLERERLRATPYDGHILREQLEQTGILLEGVGTQPEEAVVDLGFRGVDHSNPGVQIIHRGKIKSLSYAQRRWLRAMPCMPYCAQPDTTCAG